MRIYGIKRHSLVDGPGVRYVIFTQGCSHDCPGCQNPESHKIGAGRETTVDELVTDIKHTKHIDGLTFSGGDPILQLEEVNELTAKVKSLGLNIWLYTGYTFEELSHMTLKPRTEAIRVVDLLKDIDVVVDGPFIESLIEEGPSCLYRGSNNQRLIDVKASITSGQVIELKSLWR